MEPCLVALGSMKTVLLSLEEGLLLVSNGAFYEKNGWVSLRYLAKEERLSLIDLPGGLLGFSITNIASWSSSGSKNPSHQPGS